ncbi:Transmembrane and coiled-coil domains-containing protein 3 [Nowakowskiella sp. JEL0407]|nr:Transmembrane and coiled-coil domains-containing protein 3 [Nowakowskiella sp. JEL0407]
MRVNTLVILLYLLQCVIGEAVSNNNDKKDENPGLLDYFFPKIGNKLSTTSIAPITIASTSLQPSPSISASPTPIPNNKTLIPAVPISYEFIALSPDHIANLSKVFNKESSERVEVTKELKEATVAKLTTNETNQSLIAKKLITLDSRINELKALEDLVSRAIQLFQTAINKLNYHEEFNLFQLSVMNLKKITNAKEKDHLRLKKTNETNTDDNSILGEISRKVSDTADKLESEQQLNNALKDSKGSKPAILDTVVRVGGDKEGDHQTSHNKTTENSATVLIDSENNQYVMSRPSDITSNYDDPRFMKDLIILLISCFVCSYVFSFFNLPIFFGHILAGILLGTTGILRNLVQVETLARGMGVIFIMFFLGLEFSYAKIQKVWAVSFFGSSILLILTILAFFGLGWAFHIPFKEAFVLASAIFLSSTAIVAKAISAPEDSESPVGRAMIGICLAQDVMLGVMLAILPVLENSGIGIFYDVVQLLASLLLFLVIAGILGYYPVRFLLHHLKAYESRELYLMGTVAVCLTFIQIAEYLGIGMELSCFVAGVVISSQPRKTFAELTCHTIEPLRDLFAALFFASIGMHVYPSFLIQEGGLVIFLTVFVMVFKYVSCFLVMWGIFGYDLKSAGVISTGLAQISEFTFRGNYFTGALLYITGDYGCIVNIFTLAVVVYS